MVIFVKIILVTKPVVFTAELTFCIKQKVNGKIPLAFCPGNKHQANFQVVIPAALYMHVLTQRGPVPTRS